MEQLGIMFFIWKNTLSKEKRGDKLMFNVPGHYKYLNENELFDYYIKINK